jgi:hypothetical protein
VHSFFLPNAAFLDDMSTRCSNTQVTNSGNFPLDHTTVMLELLMKAFFGMLVLTGFGRVAHHFYKPIDLTANLSANGFAMFEIGPSIRPWPLPEGPDGDDDGMRSLQCTV